MEIYSIQSFPGKNIFSHRPVVKMVVNIGGLYDISSKNMGMGKFNKNLLELLPGLRKHYCSLGYEGGFAERLEEGTYAGHIVEHVALELQSMLGYEVIYGKTRIVSEPSLYYIVFEVINEKCGIECGKAAVDMVSRLSANEIVNMETIVKHLRRTAVESELGPSTKAIFDEARKRGIPVTRLGSDSILQIGYGKHARLIEASLTDSTSCISVDMAGNKHLTKQILADNGIPVPYGDIAYTPDSAAAIARNIGYPVVVKPYDASKGRGVTLDVENETQLRAAFDEAAKHSRAVIVERFIRGKDYRVLVVGGKVSAVAERRPPAVTGNGIHTVEELVAFENTNPLRGEDHERPLTKIGLDDIARQGLDRKGLDGKYVPAPGETVCLRYNGNLSTGGTARDCTGEIHPYNAMIAVNAAKALGLDIAGIDITAGDISAPISSAGGAVIEVNAAPGLRMHLYPTEGQPRNVAADIVDMLFPQGCPCSIPIVSVTGTNGKTTTTRLIRHTIALTGKKVGMTSSSGIYIGEECTLKGDNTGPISAGLVLSNREVEAAVLETARGGIVRKGLGYDLADVGVVVNISDDHLGLDGVNTLEDLAFAKALVIEAVKPDGYAVLNADDPMTDYLMGRAPGRVILFSKSACNPLILKHMEAGEMAVYVDNGTVYIHDGKKKMLLASLEEIPITFGGIVECNIENSLAAAAALYGLGLPAEVIQTGLQSFRPDAVTNPGRFNLFDMGDFRVMLDYSHNPPGYSAVLKCIQKMGAARLVGVIGVPGDRLDRNIREVGGMCGSAFSRLYIKEDKDLRGREPGEVAGILFDAAIKGGAKPENVEIVYSELKALEAAILDARPGDLIVMFYEEFGPALELVDRFTQELQQEVVEEVG